MKGQKWMTGLLAAGILLLLAGLTHLDRDHSQEDIRLLEQVLRRTAVACYAVEGVYPPDVAYMREHYGLTYDEDRYVVHYDLVASNFMPEITVMEKMP